MSTWVCLAGAFLAPGPGHWLSHGDDAIPGNSPAPSGISPGRSDRAGIRTELERVRTSAKALGEKTPAYLDALEQGLRDLRTRNPAEIEIYADLLSVAARRTGEPGVDLAREILAWPSPEPVKEKARGLVRTRESLGKTWSIRLAGIDGRLLDSRQLLGKVVLIHFWATWCPPCREELAHLKALLASHPSGGVEILGVNFDDSPKTLRRFVARDSITWPQHCATGGLEGAVAREFGVTSLPMLWLVDRNGRLRDLDAREDLEAKVGRFVSEPIQPPAFSPLSPEPAKN